MTLTLKCSCGAARATKRSSKTLGVTHRLNLYVAGCTVRTRMPQWERLLVQEAANLDLSPSLFVPQFPHVYINCVRS